MLRSTAKLPKITLLVHGGSKIWTQAVWPKFCYLNHFSSLIYFLPEDGHVIRIEWEDRMPSFTFLVELESILLLNGIFAQGSIWLWRVATFL